MFLDKALSAPPAKMGVELRRVVVAAINARNLGDARRVMEGLIAWTFFSM